MAAPRLALWLLFCSPMSAALAPGPEGILISGGYGTFSSVEVFIPSTGLSCSLPNLTDIRYGHTMASLTICGGGESLSCLSFSSGEWVTSHTLLEERAYHTSWETEQGVVLMGGDTSGDTSDIVPVAGEQAEPAFAMEYDTSNACAMADLTSDSVIVTGGYNTMHNVSRYDLLGWVEDLPPLLNGRTDHGCGAYMKEDGSQVFLVAGGYGNGFNDHKSVEVLTADSPTWTHTTHLPSAVYGLRGVTVANILYMTGGEVNDDHAKNKILAWLEKEQEWEHTGNMVEGRYYHAVTTIGLDDQAMEFCL